MTALLGIDLGTSAVKAVVIDEHARVLGMGMYAIPMETPAPGRAEQDPEAWWAATVLATREALRAARVTEITSIGVDAHMHGVVLLDADRKLVGRAITWADQRAASLIPELEADVGRDTFLSISGTRPAAGFMAPTLVWLTRHEPARLDAAATCILPKDYLRMRLTGHLGSDISDASATALFDIRERAWSAALTAAMGLPEHILPQLSESTEVVGTVLPEVADELGINPGVRVVTGCADQPAQAVANGLLAPGLGSVTLGTGGQILCTIDQPASDPQGRISTFCHARPDSWYQLGATLSAGLSLRWLRDIVGLDGPDAYTKLDALAASVEPGAEGLTFLPYLVGERSPVMDPGAAGAFVGLTLRHGRAHLARAVLEGVACSLRATRDATRDAGGRCHSWLATGNGLASPVWRGIVADTFGEPLDYVDAPERTGVGAALVAGIGAGVFADYAEAAAVARPPLIRTEPGPAAAATADRVYERYAHVSATILASGSATDPG